MQKSITLTIASSIAILTIGLISPVSSWSSVQPGEAGDFGLGAILGSPTGLSLKYWFGPQAAIDGGFAWHFGHDGNVDIHSDYLWHIRSRYWAVPNGQLPFYIGAGLRVIAGRHSEAGLRIPLGVSYLIQNAPLEVFAEIVPVMRFAPDTAADLDGGIGVRYYFKTGR